MLKIDRNDVQYLYKAILSLQTLEECTAFLDDICTIQELDSLAQRLEVARLLAQGKNYGEINKLTGASTATICRVSKCFHYGDGGYRTVLDKLRDSGDSYEV